MMKHLPKCVLITGSTDGIVLFTAKLFAKNASSPLILGIHGRNEQRLKNSIEIIKSEIPTQRMNQITIEQFCYDLSTMEQVKLFSEEVKEKLPNLDCLINNAAIFDKNGPHKSNDGFEMTFQVNVLAPFMLTLLLGTTLKPFRIINTSSMSHTDSKHHLKQLDYEVPINLNYFLN